MKVCLGQINTTPGDFPGNQRRIEAGIDIAVAGGCDAIVFPELSIPGYLSQDLIYDKRYVDRNLGVLADLISYTQGHEKLHVLVGYIGRRSGPGKPFANMAALIKNGELVQTYQKQLLPFYDVFDELRYFEAGSELAIVEIAGQSVGIAICEDLWNDKGSDDYHYEQNPLHRYRAAGVDVVFTLNASPFVHGKCRQRLQVIVPGCEDLSLVYVNQRGGQDELVFDGQSFVVRAGDLLYLSNELFADSYPIVDLQQDVVKIPAVRQNLALIETVPLYDLLVLCLRDYVEKSGFQQLVLASSGGVDSAVVCQIACDAVGAKNVHAIRMPSVFSSDHARDDARKLHENLGCWDYEVPINHHELVTFLNEHFTVHPDNLLTAGHYAAVANENIQARMRDLFVMHFSNAFGAMPLSTGNKTESACGYYTHFDMNFSFAPIKDLYKFEVFNIAKSHGAIPANIWQKPPSAELATGQFDEESLLPYAVLDPIVCAHVEHFISTFEGFTLWFESLPPDEKVTGDRDQFEAWLKSEDASLDFWRILGMIGRMEYKRRQTCPGTKVSRVAFGIGRRIPIVEKWS